MLFLYVVLCRGMHARRVQQQASAAGVSSCVVWTLMIASTSEWLAQCCIDAA